MTGMNATFLLGTSRLSWRMWPCPCHISWTLDCVQPWSVLNLGKADFFSPTKRQPQTLQITWSWWQYFVEAFLKCWGSQQQIDVYNTGTLKASMKWHARPWLLGDRFCDLSKMEVSSDYADLSSKRSVSMTIEGRVSHFTIFIRGFTEGIDHLRVVTVQGMIQLDTLLAIHMFTIFFRVFRVLAVCASRQAAIYSTLSRFDSRSGSIRSGLSWQMEESLRKVIECDTIDYLHPLWALNRWTYREWQWKILENNYVVVSGGFKYFLLSPLFGGRFAI